MRFFILRVLLEIFLIVFNQNIIIIEGVHNIKSETKELTEIDHYEFEFNEPKASIII